MMADKACDAVAGQFGGQALSDFADAVVMEIFRENA